MKATIKQTCACGATVEVSGSTYDVGMRQYDFNTAHKGHETTGSAGEDMSMTCRCGHNAVVHIDPETENFCRAHGCICGNFQSESVVGPTTSQVPGSTNLVVEADDGPETPAPVDPCKNCGHAKLLHGGGNYVCRGITEDGCGCMFYEARHDVSDDLLDALDEWGQDGYVVCGRAAKEIRRLRTAPSAGDTEGSIRNLALQLDVVFRLFHIRARHMGRGDNCQVDACRESRELVRGSVVSQTGEPS